MVAVGDYVVIKSPTIGGADLARVTAIKCADVILARRVLRQQRTVLVAPDSALPGRRLAAPIECVYVVPRARLRRAC